MKTNKPTHTPVYSLGADNALDVVEQAFVSISSVQARRNDEGMDMLANDLKRAHEVLKEERAELLAACKAMVAGWDDFMAVDDEGREGGSMDSAATQIPKLRAAIAKAEVL